MHDTTTRHDTPDTTPQTPHSDTTAETGDTTGDTTTTRPAWTRPSTYGQYVPLPRRTTAVALYDGSVDGTARIWKWAIDDGWNSLKTRGAAVGGGAVITAYSIATTAPPVNGILATAATGTWITWALINAPSPAEKKRRAEAAARAAKEQAAQKAAEKAAKKARRWGAKQEKNTPTEIPAPAPAPAPDPDPEAEEAPEPPAPTCRINTKIDLIHWLHEAIGDRNGIHLDELHNRLSAEPGLTTLERAHLAPLLDRHDIPYHRAISVDGIAGRTGVKRADVQTLLKASPMEAPQAP